MTSPMTTRRTLLLLAIGGVAGCTRPTTPPLPTALTPAPSTAVATGAVPTARSASPTLPSAPPAVSATATPSSLPTAEPGLPYSTAPASAPATGSGFQLNGVRIGAHDTYDRVVVDLSQSEGAPLWSAGYVTRFQTQGRGNTVTLPGDGHLLVRLQAMGMPTTGPFVSGDLTLTSGSVKGVYVDPWFEGQVQVMIGVDKVRGYRVFSLANPTRLVIDVQR